MPRKLCRIVLEVVEVREELLWDITLADLRREGITPERARLLAGPRAASFARTPFGLWAAGWDAINGKKPGASWKDNPRIVVTTFRRIGGSRR